MSEDESRARRTEGRAYLIWERENRPEGLHLDHWLRAEAEIAREEAAHPAGASEPPAEAPPERSAERAEAPAAPRQTPARKDPTSLRAG